MGFSYLVIDILVFLFHFPLIETLLRSVGSRRGRAGAGIARRTRTNRKFSLAFRQEHFKSTGRDPEISEGRSSGRESSAPLADGIDFSAVFFIERLDGRCS